jgi:kelch-like protein 10
MHTKRCYVSVATYNHYIFALGGFDGSVRLNTAEKLNIETNEWTRIAQMHTQRSDASASILDGNNATFRFFFLLKKKFYLNL